MPNALYPIDSDVDVAGNTQRIGEDRRLIVAPPVQPARMQRHRYDHLGVRHKLAARALHPRHNQRRQIEPIGMFESSAIFSCSCLEFEIIASLSSS